MSDLGQFIAPGTVRFERLVPGPVERLWAYLTDRALLEEWLGGGEIAETVGGKVELRAGGPLIRGVVLAREAPTRLAYTWNPFMPGDDQPAAAQAVVAFELDPREAGTKLTLTLGPLDALFCSVTAAGWHALLDILVAAVTEQPAPDFMQIIENVHAHYEQGCGGA